MSDAQPRQTPRPGLAMPKADFVTGVFLLAFSITIVVLSVQMPRLEHRGINPYTVPGIVPGLLGVALTIMSVSLVLRSVRHGGYRVAFSVDQAAGIARKPVVWRALVTAVFCLFYALALVGRIWYPAATFLFVLGFIVLFEYRFDRPFRTQWGTVLFATVEALLTAAVVSAVFRYLFLVRLP
ncbi:MAG: hypothetical protein EA403_15620 [Spirochaetaceae bacterium]|nr:MAG: hypothetical protein EA403_15620 [Spirochaetaceae bacterium]